MLEQERQIIEYGKANGRTKDETLAALARYREMSAKAQFLQTTEQPEEKSDLMQAITDIPSDIVETAKGIKETIVKRGEKQGEILSRDAEGKQGTLSSIWQTATNLASTVTEVMGQVVMGLGKLGTSQKTEDAIKSKVSEVAQKALNTPEVQQFIQNYKDLEKSNPEMAANLVATVEGGAFLLEFLGLKGVKVGAEATIRGGKAITEGVIQTGKEVAGTAIRTGERVVGALEKPLQTTLNTLDAARDVASMAGESITRIPGRVAVNVAEKQAIEQTIKALPRTAQEAVRQGVDITDVRTLGSLAISEAEKPVAKKLVDSVKRLAQGFTDANPIEVVGEPIVNRLKELDTLKKSVGKQIGEVAKNLGKVSTEELEPAIMAQLQKVPGLQGLKRTASGALNFDDTVLRLAENKSARDAIRKLFNQAIIGESGAKKNLLRQGLFESLGGKKRALANLTSTEEQAYEAIRKGLADVLDTKNSSYKTLNQQYAQIVEPLDDMLRLLKAAEPNAIDEGLNITAGILARRLTSTAISQGDIARVLKAMDDALKVAGKEGVSVEKIQTLYNLLNRYYDIAPKTGFQGGVRAGIESVGGVSEAVTKAVRGVAGETDAVRQKALENLLNELLK